MRYLISIIIPYYDHPVFLNHQINIWNSYGENIRENFEIILVDDGSKTPLMETLNNSKVILPINIKAYRIKEDIYWNVKGARNLGAFVSSGDWLLFHDFDHWFDEDNLVKILNYNKSDNEIYQFSRLREGIPAKLHKETHLIKKDNFLNKIGGHDEDEVGIYGGGFKTYYERAIKCGYVLKQIEDIFVHTVDNTCFDDLKSSVEVKKNRSIYVPTNRKDKTGMLRFEWERVL